MRKEDPTPAALLPASQRRGRRKNPPLPPDELERLRQSGLKKLEEGRSRELTSVEAGAVGGSMVRDAFNLLRGRAAEHGHSVLDEVRELTEEEAQPTEA